MTLTLTFCSINDVNNLQIYTTEIHLEWFTDMLSNCEAIYTPRYDITKLLLPIRFVLTMFCINIMWYGYVVTIVCSCVRTGE